MYNAKHYNHSNSYLLLQRYANALEYSFLIHNVCTLTIADPFPSRQQSPDSSGHPCKVYVLFKTTTFLQTKLEQLPQLLLQHCLIQAMRISVKLRRYIIVLR